MSARRVFVVDDAEDLRLVFGMSLGMAGFDVVGEAADGTEALVAAPGLAPDVVLIDLLLPDMSGLDVVRELRTQLPYAHLVLCTGMDHAEIDAQAREAGADARIDKSQASDMGTALLGVLATLPDR